MNLLLRKKDNFEILSDHLFANFFKNPITNHNIFMKSDIVENKNGYEIIIDIPGFSKEDIKISLEEGNLEVSVSSKKEESKDEVKYLRKERFNGTFIRTYYVGDHIKTEDINASLNNGVLKLFIPKKEIEKVEKAFININ